MSYPKLSIVLITGALPDLTIGRHDRLATSLQCLLCDRF